MPIGTPASARTSRRIELLDLIVALVATLSFVWVGAKVSHEGTTPFDANLRQWIHSFSGPGMTQLLSVATVLGSQAVVIGASACFAILMFLQRRHALALLVVVTMSGAEVLLPILKRHFHRQRPEPFFDIGHPPSFSFPSGHALLSFCCYGLLAALGSAYFRGRIRWLIRICAAALILAIG